MNITCVTTSKNGLDTSACEFAGKQLTAKSRHGSEFALCRQLVALGCPDGALIVTNPAGAELMRFPSIHKGAGLTIQEGREGERLAPFSNPAAKLLGDHQECTEQQIAGEIGSDRLRAGKSEPAPVSARAA